MDGPLCWAIIQLWQQSAQKHFIEQLASEFGARGSQAAEEPSGREVCGATTAALARIVGREGRDDQTRTRSRLIGRLLRAISVLWMLQDAAR